MILPSDGDSVWWLSWERQKTNSSNTPVNAALPASNRRFHYGCFCYVTLLKPVWWGFLSAVTKTSWQSFRPVVSLLPFLSKTAVLSCHQRQVRWHSCLQHSPQVTCCSCICLIPTMTILPKRTTRCEWEGHWRRNNFLALPLKESYSQLPNFIFRNEISCHSILTADAIMKHHIYFSFFKLN